MTPPHTPSTAPLAPAEGPVADPAQRALAELLAAVAALLPPGMIEALAAAAADVVAETQQLAMRAAESEAARKRERDDEIAALRAAARAAEAAHDNERAARLAAEDAARNLQARNDALRGAVADIGARTAMILAADLETPAAAQAPGDRDDNDADGGERSAAPAIPQSGEDGQPLCRRDPPCAAAAVGGPSDRIDDRAPRPGATAPQ